MVAMLIGLQIFSSQAEAQNIPTAIGPGTYIAVGGEFSAFQSDYGKRVLTGGTIFAEVNPTWRIGFEAEARYLRYNTYEDVTETNYLVGPRVMIRPGPLRPYVKFLVGAGKINFPFHYADGTFLAYAPGGGLDYLLNERVTIRVVDLEYQFWPGFASYGALHPYGVSAGFSYRLNAVEHLPKNARRSRWH